MLQCNALQRMIGVCKSGLLEADMARENVTFRLDSEKRAALDAIAAGMDRDRSYVLNEAISLYLEMHRWQIQEIQKGIEEADAGDFATDEEVQAVFARLTNGS